MPKAYWISTYEKVLDDNKLAAYAALAGPALSAGGGRFLARGIPGKTYEGGLSESRSQWAHRTFPVLWACKC